SNLTWLSRFPAAVPAGGAILIVTFFVASAPMLNGVAGETKLTHVETIRVPPVGHDEPELLKPVKPAIPLVAEFLLVTASAISRCPPSYTSTDVLTAEYGS